MLTKLHLMDDRSVLKTEVVGDDLSEAFYKLMDHIIKVLPEYPCTEFDIYKDMWNVIERDVTRAKNRPVDKNSILEFNTEMFSIAIHKEM